VEVRNRLPVLEDLAQKLLGYIAIYGSAIGGTRPLAHVHMSRESSWWVQSPQAVLVLVALLPVQTGIPVPSQ
jgi:hypothetical protein